MKFKKITLLLGVVLGISAFSLLPLPAKAFYFEDLVGTFLQYPSTHAIAYHWDYYYKHRVEFWGVLDGQGHYLKITFEIQAWVRGAVYYYRRDYSMRMGTGQQYSWYEAYTPWPPIQGGPPLVHQVCDYSYSAPQYRPVFLSIWSITAFDTIQR
jgi:hypothetical protein